MKRIFAAAAVAAMLAAFFCGCTSDKMDVVPSNQVTPTNTPVVTANVTTSPTTEPKHDDGKEKTDLTDNPNEGTDRSTTPSTKTGNR